MSATGNKASGALANVPAPVALITSSAAEALMREVALDIRGLGLILYSPPAVAHIAEGADYLRAHFWEPADVARHVMECQLTAFGTGSPGKFRLRFADG